MNISLQQFEQKRQAECPSRRGYCCELINVQLGWKHGCPPEDCNACWDKGGPQGGEGEREKIVRKYVQVAKDNLGRAPKEVLESMIQRHLTKEEAEALQLSEEYQWTMTREERWARVRHTWDMAESWTRAMLSRGLKDNRVELHIKGERILSCFGTVDNHQVMPPCPALRKSKDGKHHYCGECGCGDRSRAFLDGEPYAKLDYPYLQCPRGKRGFSLQGGPASPTAKPSEPPFPPTPW